MLLHTATLEFCPPAPIATSSLQSLTPLWNGTGRPVVGRIYGPSDIGDQGTNFHGMKHGTFKSQNTEPSTITKSESDMIREACLMVPETIQKTEREDNPCVELTAACHLVRSEPICVTFVDWYR